MSKVESSSRTPLPPQTQSLTELTAKVRELELRLEKIEGRNEEYMIYFSAYTGYLKAYTERFANIANRKELLSTGLVESRKFAKEAVRLYREGLVEESLG